MNGQTNDIGKSHLITKKLFDGICSAMRLDSEQKTAVARLDQKTLIRLFGAVRMVCDRENASAFIREPVAELGDASMLGRLTTGKFDDGCCYMEQWGPVRGGTIFDNVVSRLIKG